MRFTLLFEARNWMVALHSNTKEDLILHELFASSELWLSEQIKMCWLATFLVSSSLPQPNIPNVSDWKKNGKSWLYFLGGRLSILLFRCSISPRRTDYSFLIRQRTKLCHCWCLWQCLLANQFLLGIL